MDETDIGYSLASLVELIECLAGDHTPECETTAVALADTQRALAAVDPEGTAVGYVRGEHADHAAYQVACIEAWAFLGP